MPEAILGRWSLEAYYQIRDGLEIDRRMFSPMSFFGNVSVASVSCLEGRSFAADGLARLTCRCSGVVDVEGQERSLKWTMRRGTLQGSPQIVWWGRAPIRHSLRRP